MRLCWSTPREPWPLASWCGGEPVKKHGPGVACALDRGDAPQAIPFRKVIGRAAPASEGFTRRPDMARRQKTRGHRAAQWSTINPDAAGLDVGATFHVVAVAPDRDAQPVRTFGTFSGDL